MVYHRSSKAAPGAEQSANAAKNVFRNDGSFLEMFKRMQEASSSSSSSSSAPEPAPSAQKPSVSSAADDKPVPQCEGNKVSSAPPPMCATGPRLPMVGKRRGGRVLPTGQVKKVKVEKEEVKEDKPKDAWSQYLAEVKRYKETTCEEEGKTRPLVK